MWAHKCQFLRLGAATDHRGGVGFGAGGGKGEHRAEGEGGFDGCAEILEDFPGVAIVVDGGTNEFGAIEHGTTADGENPVDRLLAAEFDGGHERVEVGVCLYAPMFEHHAIAERGGDLVIDAVDFDRSTTREEQNFGRGGDLIGEGFNLAAAKVESGGIVKSKVIHVRVSVWAERKLASGRMSWIDGVNHALFGGRGETPFVTSVVINRGKVVGEKERLDLAKRGGVVLLRTC